MSFDAKPLYEAIGEYVIGFQWFVNKLWLAATFAEHPEQTAPERWALVDLSVVRLIDRLHRGAMTFVRRWRPEESARFEEELQLLVERCHEARRQRNRFLHSAYVHLEAGDELRGILRSNITWRNAPDSTTPEFDQEFATPELFRVELEQVVRTGYEVGQCHLQLIHWYRPDSANTRPLTSV